MRYGFHLSFVAALMFAGCFENDTLLSGTDNASETTNGITGIVQTQSGDPVSNIEVRLFPVNYNPVSEGQLPSSFTVSTDESGKYSFENIPAGQYNIDAGKNNNSLRALVRDIKIDSGELLENIELNLQKSSTLSFALGDYGLVLNDYILIPGTNIFQTVGTEDLDNGRFTLAKLAPGVYVPAYYYRPKARVEVDIFHSPITVEAGVDFEVPLYANWGFSRQITINTSSAGANTTTPEYLFPLALYFDGDNMNIAQSNFQGGDIRFTNKHGQAMPYQVERWDQDIGIAEIWVSVDTVWPQDADQFINMHWGNPGAIPATSGPHVFSEEAGFVGVWHYAEIPSEGHMLDAGEHRAHGIPSGSFRVEESVESVIGRGLEFDDENDYVDLSAISPHIKNGNPLTLSLWFKADDLGRTFFVSGGTSNNDNEIFRVGLTDAGQLELQVARDPEVAGPRFDDNEWHMVVAVFGETGERHVYVDGEEIEGYFETKIPDMSTLGNVISGAEWDETNLTDQFGGLMDEVRIEWHTRSLSWARLCHATQKRDGAVVTLGAAND